MNNKILKLNIITAAIIVVVLFISISYTIFNFLNTDFNTVYDNDIRVLVSSMRNEIEKGIYSKEKYDYIVAGLDGKVLYNNSFYEAKKGDFINLQEMIQTDKSFNKNYKGMLKRTFILRKNGSASGFAVFFIPQKEVLKYTSLDKVKIVFFPMLLGITISICISFLRAWYLNSRILKPIREITFSAKGIIAGNYDLEVVRTFEREIGENEIGDLTYSFELMRDELKEKQIREEALKKSQQELISCISHDLKTPISTIKAYSEGLRDGIAKTEDSKESFVNVIIAKTDLLISMINELLEYSNAELNKLDINLKEVYFLDYFKNVMKELSIYVKQKEISFSYDIETPNMIVTIDKKRITEVLYNLVENSMKYIGDKKGYIKVYARRQGQFILIKVVDNGIGIDSDDIPYVFDKFYRAEKSRSSSIPGSGLGLSICKFIIEEHGGEIYCKSSLNGGCEIGFTVK